MSDYTELKLIEQPAIALFAELGYETRDCYHETFGLQRTLGREPKHDVMLTSRLRMALQRLNPGLPAASIEKVVELIARERPSCGHHNAEMISRGSFTVSFMVSLSVLLLSPIVQVQCHDSYSHPQPNRDRWPAGQ